MAISIGAEGWQAGAGGSKRGTEVGRQGPEAQCYGLEVGRQCWRLNATGWRSAGNAGWRLRRTTRNGKGNRLSKGKSPRNRRRLFWL
ncbi:MAG: hypothetical protein FWH55_13605 [Oscillospiraceae bacterium]|nr:hypothetical protein [Oscillospiraceae bacterium]